MTQEDYYALEGLYARFCYAYARARGVLSDDDRCMINILGGADAITSSMKKYLSKNQGHGKIFKFVKGSYRLDAAGHFYSVSTKSRASRISA